MLSKTGVKFFSEPQPQPSEWNNKADNYNKCPQTPAEEARKHRMLNMHPRGKGQDVACNKTITLTFSVELQTAKT